MEESVRTSKRKLCIECSCFDAESKDCTQDIMNMELICLLRNMCGYLVMIKGILEEEHYEEY